jgi:hypothetical protein
MPLFKFTWEDLEDNKYETIIVMPTAIKARYFKDCLQRDYFEVQCFEFFEVEH